MDNILIRPAVATDVPAIRSLELEMIAHERKIAPSLAQDREIGYHNIPATINNVKRSLMLVVEKDGEVIGCGYGQVRINETCFQEALYGHIGLLSIKPAYRGNGYGNMIIEKLLDWFRQKGLKEAKLRVFAGNDGAIRSYKRAGFAEHQVEMRRDL